jgi:hypothetical protein
MVHRGWAQNVMTGLLPMTIIRGPYLWHSKHLALFYVSPAAISSAPLCILPHILVFSHLLFSESLHSFAPPVVLCMSFCAHSLPLSHALFPKFLRSFAPPVVSCSVCGGPSERCCGVCFCLRTGSSPVSGVSVVASCTSWRFLLYKGRVQQRGVGVIAVGEKWTISLSRCDCSFWSFILLA